MTRYATREFAEIFMRQGYRQAYSEIMNLLSQSDEKQSRRYDAVQKGFFDKMVPLFMEWLEIGAFDNTLPGLKKIKKRMTGIVDASGRIV